MRRKPGTLLPIELSILTAGINLLRTGQPEFHGYAIAREIRDIEAAKRLTSQGTLYRALDRLEQQGALKSRLEDAEIAATASRPRRRLYLVTAQGEEMLNEAVRNAVIPFHSLKPGPATS